MYFFIYSCCSFKLIPKNFSLNLSLISRINFTESKSFFDIFYKLLGVLISSKG